jgi:ATP/maltotriose-dependent transcriptional regulator MalT
MLEGRLPEAREILRNSGRAMRRIGAGTLALEADIRLAEVHLASGEATAASALAGKVLEASKKADSPPIEGRALRLLGVLAARRKRPDEAESLLRESIALFAAAGSAHGEAKSRLALGLALGDKTEARKALRAFQRLGAARDAGEAEGLLAA